MQEGDILSAKEAAYIERLEIENGELQVNVLSAAAPAATWLLPSNGLPPQDDETSRRRSVSCLIIHHGDRVSKGYFYLMEEPEDPSYGFDEVTQDCVSIDAWMPLPEYSQAVRQRYIEDRQIGKRAVAALMAEAAERQHQRETAPAPAPEPYPATEADWIAADLHNCHNKASKAYAAQTQSAVALEFKHNRQGVAV